MRLRGRFHNSGDEYPDEEQASGGGDGQSGHQPETAIPVPHSPVSLPSNPSVKASFCTLTTSCAYELTCCMTFSVDLLKRAVLAILKRRYSDPCLDRSRKVREPSDEDQDDDDASNDEAERHRPSPSISRRKVPIDRI